MEKCDNFLGYWTFNYFHVLCIYPLKMKTNREKCRAVGVHSNAHDKRPGKRREWHGWEKRSPYSLAISRKRDNVSGMNGNTHTSHDCLSVSYDRGEESFQSKVKWFKSLTLNDRMDMLCSFTDLVLDVNPKIADRKDAQPIKRSFQVLSRK